MVPSGKILASFQAYIYIYIKVLWYGRHVKQVLAVGCLVRKLGQILTGTQRERGRETKRQRDRDRERRERREADRERQREATREATRDRKTQREHQAHLRISIPNREFRL